MPDLHGHFHLENGMSRYSEERSAAPAAYVLTHWFPHRGPDGCQRGQDDHNTEPTQPKQWGGFANRRLQGYPLSELAKGLRSSGPTPSMFGSCILTWTPTFDISKFCKPPGSHQEQRVLITTTSVVTEATSGPPRAQASVNAQTSGCLSSRSRRFMHLVRAGRSVGAAWGMAPVSQPFIMSYNSGRSEGKHLSLLCKLDCNATKKRQKIWASWVKDKPHN